MEKEYQALKESSEYNISRYEVSI